MGLSHAYTMDLLAGVFYQGHMVGKDDVTARREALRRFMFQRNLKAASWAMRAKRSPNAIYNFLAGRSHSLSLPTARALASVEGVTVDDILGPGYADGDNTNVIPISRHVVVPVYQLEGIVGPTDFGEVVESVVVTHGYISQFTADPSSLVGIAAMTEPMAPQVRRSDIVLVDRSQTDLEDGMWLFSWRGRVYLREIRINRAAGTASLVAKDTDFSTHEGVPLSVIEPIGRVVLRYGPV